MLTADLIRITGGKTAGQLPSSMCSLGLHCPVAACLRRSGPELRQMGKGPRRPWNLRLLACSGLSTADVSQVGHREPVARLFVRHVLRSACVNQHTIAPDLS